MADPLVGPPLIETVLQAVTTLYHDSDAKQKESASQWLQQLQKSVHAWKVADELLHRKADVESCYFAAQTMRTKIQSSFSELPQEAHVSLRNSLLEHVAGIDENTSSIIVTQISVALADLALQMPEWPNFIVELIQRFATSRPFALLEILVVLPEEVNCRHLRLGANRREEIIQELKRSALVVNEFLQACLAEKGRDSQQFRTNILRCLMSWVTLGLFPLEGIERNRLTSFAFEALSAAEESHNVHEAAADAVCALLERLEEMPEQGSGGLELYLYTLVRKLEPAYSMSVAIEDIFRSVNFCRIFTELAESLLIKIVSQPPHNPHFALGILDSVLLCCGNPDYEIPDITFNLWYRLAEEVYHRNDNDVTAVFKPYVERLIVALAKHCQMEPDSDGILEEGEDFTEFRLRVLELVKDVVFIVGSEAVFKHMFQSLASGSPEQWEVTEASLFIMSAVARNILPEDDVNVPPVLSVVLEIPPTAHVAVRHTAFKLVGKLGDWVDKHGEYLDRILNWILSGLQDPKLASEAATALQNICSSCQRHMGPHFDGLIQIMKSLDNFSLKPLAANGLIKGVAAVLTNMPHGQIQNAMKTLCWLQVVPLQSLIESPTLSAEFPKELRQTTQDPVLYLDRLSSILRYVTPDVPEGTQHPCQPVVLEVWPILSKTCDRFKSDIRIMERCCRAIRFAVRCVRTQSAPLLEPLVKQMVTLYQQHPHSCFLYLGSILVDEFSHLPECVPFLLSMLESFLPVTFQLLQAEGGLKEHPDTVDDFFRLNARFLQRAPISYLSTKFLVSVLDCGLLSTTLEHREANASVMKFFFDLLHTGRSREDKDDFDKRVAAVTAIKDQVGPRLVSTLVSACVHNLPTYAFYDVGDVIFELMLFDRVSVCHWLEAALRAMDRTGPTPDQERVTMKQLSSFHAQVTKAEEPKAVADALRHFTRLWR